MTVITIEIFSSSRWLQRVSELAMRDLFPMLSIGGLPTTYDLNSLYRQGVRSLVNLSGTRLDEIYSGLLLRRFDVYDFYFRDLFSRMPMSGINHLMTQYQDGEIVAIIQAINRVESLLMRNDGLHCFCHQGISRSSLVVAVALMRGFDLSDSMAMDIVHSKNSRASFSTVSRDMLHFLARPEFQHAQ